MKVDAFFTANSVVSAEVEGKAAVVIDVIRATSTIVTALASGARALYPTVSSEEAIKLVSSLGREDTLLCGERKGLRIEGFDLGNSPAEYTEDVVRDKRLVMTTTNGTRAIPAAEEADRVVAACFLNLDAVVESLANEGEVVIVCAGKEDRFSLDDAACAGYLIQGLEERTGDAPEVNDAAQAAQRLAQALPFDEAFLRSTRAGQALVEIGLGSDLSLCARRDVYDLVPVMKDRTIRVTHGSGSGAE